MAIYGQDELFRQGFVPKGAEPRRISPDGSVTAFQPSKANRVAAVLTQVLQQAQANEKQRQEKLAKQFDMYKVLRDAGYDTKSAAEAVRKNQFPDAPGGESLEEQEKRASIDEKKAHAEYYRAGGAKRTVIDQMTPNQLQSRLKALNEILEPTEEDRQEMQVISKKLRTLSMGSTAEPVIEEEKEPVRKEKAPQKDGPRILMEKPDGSKVKVSVKDVNKARAKGYKVA